MSYDQHSAPLSADFAVVLYRHGDSLSGHGALPDIIRVESEEEGRTLLDEKMHSGNPYHAGQLIRARVHMDPVHGLDPHSSQIIAWRAYAG